MISNMTVERCPDNPMPGRREILDGKPGKYVWQTYEEVYELVIKVGNAMQSCGFGEGEKCGIYGVNSPEWDYKHGGLQCSWTLLCSFI
ncbi:long chain acyl-CoA synthetase 4-like [Juglans regia]|uniref:Long chain acyl-CoA synthetase 4-like n=1 Tax=Juglans regia TaxID=51240 RepID=A0A6P9E8C2_JUGRE|nr:long chain acyl-CoA synthetase 4-like [Juglans regia]